MEKNNTATAIKQVDNEFQTVVQPPEGWQYEEDDFRDVDPQEFLEQPVPDDTEPTATERPIDIVKRKVMGVLKKERELLNLPSAPVAPVAPVAPDAITAAGAYRPQPTKPATERQITETAAELPAHAKEPEQIDNWPQHESPLSITMPNGRDYFVDNILGDVANPPELRGVKPSPPPISPQDAITAAGQMEATKPEATGRTTTKRPLFPTPTYPSAYVTPEQTKELMKPMQRGVMRNLPMAAVNAFRALGTLAPTEMQHRVSGTPIASPSTPYGAYQPLNVPTEKDYTKQADEWRERIMQIPVPEPDPEMARAPEKFSEWLQPKRIWTAFWENAPLTAALGVGYAVNPIFGTMMMAAVEGGGSKEAIDDYEKKTGVRLSEAQRRGIPIAVGAVNAALEKTGIETLLGKGPLGKVAKNRIVKTLISSATESTTEALQELVSIYMELGYDENAAADMGQRTLQSFYGGLVTGGILGSVIPSGRDDVPQTKEYNTDIGGEGQPVDITTPAPPAVPDERTGTIKIDTPYAPGTLGQEPPAPVPPALPKPPGTPPPSQPQPGLPAATPEQETEVKPDLLGETPKETPAKPKAKPKAKVAKEKPQKKPRWYGDKLLIRSSDITPAMGYVSRAGNHRGESEMFDHLIVGNSPVGAEPFLINPNDEEIRQLKYDLRYAKGKKAKEFYRNRIDKLTEKGNNTDLRDMVLEDYNQYVEDSGDPFLDKAESWDDLIKIAQRDIENIGEHNKDAERWQTGGYTFEEAAEMERQYNEHMKESGYAEEDQRRIDEDARRIAEEEIRRDSGEEEYDQEAFDELIGFFGSKAETAVTQPETPAQAPTTTPKAKLRADRTTSLVDTKDARTGEPIETGEEVYYLPDTKETIKESTYRQITEMPEQEGLFSPEAVTEKKSAKPTAPKTEKKAPADIMDTPYSVQEEAQISMMEGLTGQSNLFTEKPPVVKSGEKAGEETPSASNAAVTEKPTETVTQGSSTATDIDAIAEKYGMEPGKQAFIVNKVKKLGTYEAVAETYKDDTDVDKFAREAGKVLYGEETPAVPSKSEPTPTPPKPEKVSREPSGKAEGVKYVVWALPKGETDSINEVPLTSKEISKSDADKVIFAAKKDGYHGFRLMPMQVKEPWMHTRDEFIQAAIDSKRPKDLVGFKLNETVIGSGKAHKEAVNKALAEGKPVPAEVLQDYPELSKDAEMPVAPEAEGAKEKTALSPETAKTLLAQQGDNIVFPMGPARKKVRQQVMRELTGDPTYPQSKAGANAVREALIKASGVDTKGARGEVESRVIDWLKRVASEESGFLALGSAIQKHKDNPRALELSPETRWQYFQRVIQDKLNRLEYYQGAIPNLSEDADAYMKAELFIGKAADKIERMERTIVDGKDSFLKRLSEAGYDIQQFGEYLYARHARERNKRIQSINPKFLQADLLKDSGGSGMTDAEADVILEQYKDSGLDAFAEEFYEKIPRAALKIKLDAGIIDQYQYDTLTGMYENYVPLKGKAGETSYRSIGKGFSVSSKGIKKAMGRQSYADNPFVQAIIDYEDAVVSAEKNKVGQSFLKLVRENPSDIWDSEAQAYVPQYDARGELLNMNPKQKPADNVLELWENGKKIRITMHDKALAEGMKNLANTMKGSVARAMSVVMSVNNYMRAVATFYNPEFLVTNFERDLQAAMIHLSGEQSVKLAAKVGKDLPKAMKGIWSNVREGKESEWSKLYEEMKATGGKVGWFDYKTLEQKQKHFESKVRFYQTKTDPRKIFIETGKFVSDLNEAVESGVRLSAYKNLIDAGVSKEKAAQAAKNLTVNFNKKGEWGTILNTLYLFSGASIQGTARIVKAAGVPFNPKTRGQRRVQKIIGGIMVASFLQSLANRMLDDDDYERISDYNKDNYWLFMTPSGKAVAIKLPYGYNVFHVLGCVAEEAAFGDITLGEASKRVINAANDAFNPLGGGSIAQFLSPSFLDPIVQISENKNFFGAPIMPEQPQWGEKKPDSQRYFKSVRKPTKAFTDWLNSITGGDEEISGAVDVSPETLDHFIDFAGSGLGKFITNTMTTAGTVIGKGELPPMDKIPFVRQMIKEPDDWTDKRLIREMLNESKRTKYSDEQKARFERTLKRLKENKEYTPKEAREIGMKFRLNQR